MSRSGLQRELTKNQKVEAALQNEHLTRQRVEKLERLVQGCDVKQLAAWQNAVWRIVMERGFWGRLGWLLLGR